MNDVLQAILITLLVLTATVALRLEFDARVHAGQSSSTLYQWLARAIIAVCAISAVVFADAFSLI